MPDSAEAALRIYCTCGAKMKVSNSMYGLPGKCVECRQKIRLPREDEIPEGATEIFLKDHPHLIRKPGKSSKQKTRDGQKALDTVPKPSRSDGEPTPVTELDIEETSQPDSLKGATGTRPLDPCESLQLLTSLELKVLRRLREVTKSKPVDKTLKAEYKGHLMRITDARKGLDEHFHQLLMEVAIELTNTQEKISQTQIAARVGEEFFEEYQDTVYRLRHRRDRLEHRQLNLRGWLAIDDPFNAGGYIDAQTDEIPDDGFSLSIPNEPHDTTNLLTAHSSKLKHALDVRKNTEARLVEIKDLGEASEGKKKIAYADTYETAKGTRRMAKAQIQFYQQRLNQLAKDYETDLETLEAQREAGRDKLSMNSISRVEFDAIDQSLLRAKTDISKGIGLAKRLIHANSIDDVPDARGTFLNRLGFGGGNAVDRTVSVTLWATAVLWILSVMLPAVGTSSLIGALRDFGGTGSAAPTIIVLPVIAAILTAAISLLTNSGLRALSLMLLWVGSTLLIAYCTTESNFSLNPLANRFRSGAVWYLRPGMVAMLIANILTLICALKTLGTRKSGLAPAIGTVVIAGAVALFIATNGFNQFVPRPAVENTLESFSAETGKQTGRLRVSNSGNRTLHLVSRRTSALNGYLYTIDRKIGGTSFSEVTPDGQELGAATTYKDISVAPGEHADIDYELPVGDYRLLLISHADDGDIEKAFSIVDPNPTARKSQPIEAPKLQLVEAEPVTTDLSEPTSDSELDVVPAFPGPDRDALPAIQLSGIITGADSMPHFTLELYTQESPRGRTVKASLNDTLPNGWILSEFNPSLDILTLRKETRVLIIARGERHPFDT